MRHCARSTVSALLALAALGTSSGDAQVRVNPTGVNVNTQGANTVFLTFGGVAGYQPVEASWCGELIDAAPAIGLRCDPATIFGQLPIRYNLLSASGTNALTDIMTIPASVSRRAYQAAEAGAPSAFFYVRRFQSLTGGPDEYVAVTCRLTGGGARTPLSLTDVRVAFGSDLPVLQIAQNEMAPPITAAITYTGTGRLTGRWEIVLPGDELPTVDDLLTEATLPIERRSSQRRYTQLSRFNVFLPPTGSVMLPGPETERLPTSIDGVYHILLRIEATSEKEGDSNLSAVGAGIGTVPGGAVAGFPMPMLRYVVGSGQSIGANDIGPETIALVSPLPDATIHPDSTPVFTWRTFSQAALYTIEIETAADGTRLISALIPGTVAAYRIPPWLPPQVADRPIRWRVIATDAGGRAIARSAWRTASFRIEAGF